MSSSRPKKILHIITSSGIGGAELMLCRLLERNDPRRHQQAVLSLLAPHSLKERIESSASLYSLRMRPPLPRPKNFRDLRRIIRDYQPDLIQGWMYHGNLAAILGAKLAGFKGPVLWNIRHSLHDLRLEKPVLRQIIRLNAWFSGSPQAIIFNATTSIRQHQELGFPAERCIFVPNGVDCEANRPMPEIRDEVRAELGIDAAAPLIGMMARHHPMKDPDNLFKALAIVRESLPDVRLIVAGERFDRDNQPVLDSLAALGLDDHVQLLGRRTDIPRLLAAIDVVASPSGWGEGFPNTLGEAAAAGVPAVATDIGDTASVVGDGGRIVPPRDAEALAAALLDMLKLDPAERREIGAAGRRRIESHFELGVIAEHFANLYDAFMDPANRAAPPADLLSELSLSAPPA